MLLSNYLHQTFLRRKVLCMAYNNGLICTLTINIFYPEKVLKNVSNVRIKLIFLLPINVVLNNLWQCGSLAGKCFLQTIKNET